MQGIWVSCVDLSSEGSALESSEHSAVSSDHLSSEDFLSLLHEDTCVQAVGKEFFGWKVEVSGVVHSAVVSVG